MWPNSITSRGHTRLYAALWWISPRMENPWHLWTACSKVSLCSSCTFFLVIFHQYSFCCSMYLLTLIPLLGTFEKSLALSFLQTPISWLQRASSCLLSFVQAEQAQLSPVQPLLVCQVLSCPWPHCWLLTGLPACLSCTLGSPNQTHNSRYFPQAE